MKGNRLELEQSSIVMNTLLVYRRWHAGNQWKLERRQLCEKYSYVINKRLYEYILLLLYMNMDIHIQIEFQNYTKYIVG